MPIDAARHFFYAYPSVFLMEGSSKPPAMVGRGVRGNNKSDDYSFNYTLYYYFTQLNNKMCSIVRAF